MSFIRRILFYIALRIFISCNTQNVTCSDVFSCEYMSKVTHPSGSLLTNKHERTYVTFVAYK